MAVLGFHCCVQAFLKLQQVWASLQLQFIDFSLWWLLMFQVWALGWAGLVVVAQGLVVLRHVDSSQPRDQTLVAFTGRWNLHHWPTREFQSY